MQIHVCLPALIEFLELLCRNVLTARHSKNFSIWTGRTRPSTDTYDHTAPSTTSRICHSARYCILWHLQQHGSATRWKKGSAFTNATGVKMKQASKHWHPAVGTNSTTEQGAGARISMLLTRSPPSLITMQALSASGESLYYFQVSPIVSHCDKAQDDLTQWWITPDIEFSRGCQAISVGCITWKCHRIQTQEQKQSLGSTPLTRDMNRGVGGLTRGLLIHTSLCSSGVNETAGLIKTSSMQIGG